MKKLILFLILMLFRIVIASYIDTVKSIQPAHLIQYLPMNETSGTTAYDSSGNGLNGTYTNCTLNQDGFKDNEKSVSFNGTSSKCAIYSTTLNTRFNPTSGSVLVWFQSSETPFGGTGSGGVKVILKLQYSSTNFIQIGATNAKIQIYNTHKGVNSLAEIDTSNIIKTDWMCVVLTWTSGKSEIYFDGARVNKTDVAYSGWDAGALVSANTLIGSTAGAYFYKGNICHYALWDTSLTKSEIIKLSEKRLYSAIFFGNSITTGQGASVPANMYVNVLSKKFKFPWWKNNGISGTILQNSPAPIFSNLPQVNNGRDRFDTALCQYLTDYVFILYGLNDLRCNDAAVNINQYTTQYNFIVDSLIKSGFDKNKILLGSPPLQKSYTGGSPFNGGTIVKHLEYIDSVKSVAVNNGVKFVDVYNYMKTHGDTSLVSIDNIHPNDLGHSIIASAFYDVLTRTPILKAAIDTLHINVATDDIGCTFQWQKNKVDISDSTRSGLTICADSALYATKPVYRCVVTNSNNTATTTSKEWQLNPRMSATGNRWISFIGSYISAYK